MRKHASKTLVFLTLLLGITSIAFSQRWKHQRIEYVFSIGASNFLGDLGGRDQIGTDYSPVDIEFKLTRPAGGLGYRYRVLRDLYVKANLLYGRINGDDALTQEPARHTRNLKFRSPIIELSHQWEWVFIHQKSGHLYRLKGVKGQSWFRFNVYAFAGLGGIWFNPKGPLNGGTQWVALQPLGTEGQGIIPGTKKYSRITAVIPYGLGINRDLGGRTRFGKWSVTLEIGVRKTFSDYLDDVSGDYYDKELIRQANGDVAAYFADPSINGLELGYTTAGQQRGDPTNKDSYIFALISFQYKISKRRRHLPKF
jgi:hypothetical protein